MILPTNEEITEVFSILQTNTAEALADAYRVQVLKNALEQAKGERLLDGTIKGKNPEEREASARQSLPHLYRAVAETETEAHKSQVAMRLAALDVERVKTLLRLAEVSLRREIGGHWDG